MIDFERYVSVQGGSMTLRLRMKLNDPEAMTLTTYYVNDERVRPEDFAQLVALLAVRAE